MRPFFAILIAAAMILSPFAIRSGLAMAAMPGDHHARTTSQDHCNAPQGEPDSDRTMDKSCCAAMCGHVAIAPVAADDPQSYELGVDLPSIASIGASFLAKLPTPPPRAA